MRKCNTSFPPKSSQNPRGGTGVTNRRVTLPTWSYRLWRDQAQHLYASPEAQRLALLHHLELKMRFTVNPDVWASLAAIGARLVDEDEVTI